MADTGRCDLIRSLIEVVLQAEGFGRDAANAKSRMMDVESDFCHSYKDVFSSHLEVQGCK